jgi:hypothetical protein
MSKARLTMALLLVFAALNIVGCDPGEGVFGVSIRNDLSRDVRIRGCEGDSDCPVRLLHPGQSYEASASTQGVQWWAIEEPTGQRLGCIALPTQRSKAKAPNLVSSYVPCPPGALSVSGIPLAVVGALIAVFFGSCAVVGLILGLRELRRERARSN